MGVAQGQGTQWRRWSPFGLLLVGNQRIAASIWQTDYGDQAAGLVGSGYRGFESGHALAGMGDMLVWLGGLAFTVTLGLLRRVPAGVAVTGVVLSLLPPWILPGLGVVFVLAWLLARGSRRMAAADARSFPSAGGHSTQARRAFRDHDQRETGRRAGPEPARETWPPS